MTDPTHSLAMGKACTDRAEQLLGLAGDCINPSRITIDTTGAARHLARAGEVVGDAHRWLRDHDVPVHLAQRLSRVEKAVTTCTATLKEIRQA